MTIGERIKGFAIREAVAIVRRILNGINWLMAIRSIHGKRRFFDREDFPFVADLEANWKVIRAELEETTRDMDRIPHFSDISEDQSHLTGYGNWKTLFLYAYGFKAEENCLQCPETTRLVERIPGMQTAMFSIFRPGTDVIPHRGPYRGVLRYHLALIVPREVEKCGIKVGGEVAHWHEGQSLIFDDCFEHEAWNHGDEERVVLFVDFERPLPPRLARFNRMLLRIIQASPLVQNGLRNYEAWMKAHPLEAAKSVGD